MPTERFSAAKALRLDGPFAYALVAIVSLVAVTLDYDLGRADLRKPLSYLLSGDGVYFAAAHFKGMFDNPFYLDNAYLGAPGTCDLRDFPAPDLAYFLVIAVGKLFTSSWALVLNAFLILSFPMTAMSALYVMRRFGVGTIGAVAASLLYAFLPFHHHRLFGHPHLAVSYWEVPFGSLLALAVLRGEPVLFEGRRLLRTRASLAMIACATFVGLSGQVYYTFFALFTLAAAGIAAGTRTRSVTPLLRAGGLGGVTLAAFVLQTLPILLHGRAHGSIPLLRRNPGDSEIFALKITELVLPQTNHRYESLRRFKQIYDHTAPLVNENLTAYLGMIGAAGFVVLLVVLIRQGRDAERSLLSDLAVLNVVTVLLGTMGGVGAIVAFAGFPEVRSYNRISVCVGFYALFAVAVLVDRLVAKAKARSRAAHAGAIAAAAALTAFGIHETSFAGQPDYATQNARWAEDAAFVAEVERALPEGAMVFQLPHMTFPEAGPIQQMHDYEPMAAYLLSKRLRWSYGSMRGRRIDDWNADAAALPARQMVERLALAGFSAIWVGRSGYADRGKAVEEELAAVLGPPVLVDEYGSRAVFSLRAHADALRASLGDAQWRARSDAEVRPVYLGFYDGFNPLDRRPESYRITAGKRGRMILENPSTETRRVTLSAFARAANGPATLKLRGALVEGDFVLPAAIERTIDVPPGEHEIVLTCDGAPSNEVYGGRRIVLVLDEPRVRMP